MSMSTGKITTHVLDLSLGKPVVGLSLELWLLSDTEPKLLQTAMTNEDGRIDSPLLSGEALNEGIYEILFAAGDYYRKNNKLGDQELLFDRIPIRFTVADAQAHYHIPLLVAPGGYSTYRGS